MGRNGGHGPGGGYSARRSAGKAHPGNDRTGDGCTELVHAVPNDPRRCAVVHVRNLESCCAVLIIDISRVSLSFELLASRGIDNRCLRAPEKAKHCRRDERRQCSDFESHRVRLAPP